MSTAASRLTNADLLLVTLWKANPDATFERNPDLARTLNEASEQVPIFHAFRWNPDYESSKKLNDSLNLLDLTGMIVGENMPTRRFKLAGQAKSNFAAHLFDSLEPEVKKAVEQVAENVRKVVSVS